MREIILSNGWIKTNEGGTAECFINTHDSSVLLKLFLPKFPKESVECEFFRSIQAEQILNTPRTLEIVRVEKRYGILFDRIHGKTLTQEFESDPEKRELFAEIFLNEIRRIREIPIQGVELPEMTREVSDAIDHVFQSRFWRKKFHTRLKQISDTFPEPILLHGDRHPGNLMLKDDIMYWIDVGKLSKGAEIFDIASMNVLWNIGITQTFLPRISTLPRKEMRAFFMKILTAFAADYHMDLASARWMVHQSTFLFVIATIYSEKWSKGNMFAIKLMICLSYILSGPKTIQFESLIKN